MAWTIPATWEGMNPLDLQSLNKYLRDQLVFLFPGTTNAVHPALSRQNYGNQTFTADTEVNLQMDTAGVDTASGWNAGNYYTFPTPGVYIVNYSGAYAGSGVRGLRWRVGFGVTETQFILSLFSYKPSFVMTNTARYAQQAGSMIIRCTGANQRCAIRFTIMGASGTVQVISFMSILYLRA